MFSKSSVKEQLPPGEGHGWDTFTTMGNLRHFYILNDSDSLTIAVKCVIYGEETEKKSRIPIPLQVIESQASKKILGLCKTLLETGIFIVRVKDGDSGEFKEIKAHRSILMARSAVLKSTLTTPMTEAETGQLTIKPLSATGLNILMTWIYTGTILPEWSTVPEDLIYIAEAYDFPQLKKYADDWLHTTCTEDNALKLFQLAKLHGLAEAHENIFKFIETNLKTVLDKFSLPIESFCSDK